LLHLQELALLDASGNTTIPGNISGTGNADFSKFLGLLADTVSAPSFTWSGDLTTGIYHPTTSQIAISIAGTQRGLWSSSGLIVTWDPLVQQVLVEQFL
jgi:hypothetical protein